MAKDVDSLHHEVASLRLDVEKLLEAVEGLRYELIRMRNTLIAERPTRASGFDRTVRMHDGKVERPDVCPDEV
jgi:hypothetical protein